MGTIAARYSFKRRQFTGRDGSEFPEALVIQYQMQQYKVVPAVSYAWMIYLVANQLNSMNSQYLSEISRREAGDKTAKPFETLKHLHALAAGFKALTTWDGEKFSETMKQACGGHGYMQISGLSKIHVDFGFGWQMTEGDNYVLSQQTARYLLEQVQTGAMQLDKFEFDVANKLDLDQELLLLFEMRFKNAVRESGRKLQSGDGDFSTTWNEIALQAIVKSTVYFTQYWALKNFHELVTGTKSLHAPEGCKPVKLRERSPELQQLFSLMFRNQAMFILHENTGTFLAQMPEGPTRSYFSASKIA